MAARIKRGDKVVVIAGKDKGKTGEVTQVLPSANRVVIGGVNLMTKHRRPSPAGAGGIEKIPAPIHMSNVMLQDPRDGQPTKVGFKIVGEGEEKRKLRFARRSGEMIDS